MGTDLGLSAMFSKGFLDFLFAPGQRNHFHIPWHLHFGYIYILTPIENIYLKEKRNAG